jgi:hypothetical protein
MEEPMWVTEARSRYDPSKCLNLPEVNTETEFTRGFHAIGVLEKKVLLGSEDTIKLLLVGVGLYADTGACIYGPLRTIKCPYEPYTISAFLESQGREYKMLIVDRDKRITEDISKRTKIYIHSQTNGESWSSYLGNTRQSDRTIHKLEDGLNLHEDVLGNDFLLNLYLRQGFKVAYIPESFKEGLEKGDVCILRGDIATADLSTYGKFDFISCMNIMYILTEDGQKLAMFNLARSLADTGSILINDFEYGYANPLLPRQGGWFDKEKQRELGLIIDEVMSEDTSHKHDQTLTFTKLR